MPLSSTRSSTSSVMPCFLNQVVGIWEFALLLFVKLNVCDIYALLFTDFIKIKIFCLKSLIYSHCLLYLKLTESANYYIRFGGLSFLDSLQVSPSYFFPLFGFLFPDPAGMRAAKLQKENVQTGLCLNLLCLGVRLGHMDPPAFHGRKEDRSGEQNRGLPPESPPTRGLSPR